MIYIDNGIYAAPEWFGSRKITSGVSADLGNEECVEYLKGAMRDMGYRSIILGAPMFS